MRTFRWAVLACVLASSVPSYAADPQPASPAATTATAKSPLIPTSALAERPFLSDPAISPDGLRVAGFFNANGTQKLGVTDFATGQTALISSGEKLDFNWFSWAGSDRLLISVGSTVNFDGEEYWQTRLIAYDVTAKANRFIGGKHEGVIGDDVLWIDPEGKSVLMAYQATIYDYPDVYSIDLATNHSTVVERARTGLWDWYADNAGVVRYGFVTGQRSWQMIYRTKAGEPFRTVVKGRNEDDDTAREEDDIEVLHLFQGADDGYRVMYNPLTGKDALFRYNFATRKRGDLVFEANGVDIDDFSTKWESNDLVSTWFTDDRPRVHWFDPEFATVQDSIEKAVGAAKMVSIVSYSRDRERMIVWVGATNDPGNYYVFSQSEGKMHLLARLNQKLDRVALATTSYTSYKARDGLDVPAYLTLPPGRPAKNLPLIVMPHGGPFFVRDEGGYDAEVQFLANRGYVVLQPEFRGSSGYGRAYHAKGEGQWGRAMQDDLDDGMDWLAKQGIVDPARACIMGSSYGGYAALWGAVRNPERWRCAASFAGISDLKRQLKYQLNFDSSKRSRADWRKTVQGDPAFDLATISPLFTIDKLKTPVMLVHGDADHRVPYKQSKLYADALEKAGKPYEFYTLKDESHGFSTSANMQLWLDKLDAFLTKYNPADSARP